MAIDIRDTSYNLVSQTAYTHPAQRSVNLIGTNGDYTIPNVAGGWTIHVNCLQPGGVPEGFANGYTVTLKLQIIA